MTATTTSNSTWGHKTFFAQLAQAADQLDEAEELHREAALLARKETPGDWLPVAFNLTALGAISILKGEYEIAQMFLTEALEIRRMRLPRHHRQIAEVLHCLACTYHGLGQYDLAQGYYRQTLECIPYLPDSHPEKAQILVNLLACYDEAQTQTAPAA